MKYGKKLLLFFLSVCFCIGLFAYWLSDKYAVPILMYHNVKSVDVYHTDTVSPDNFRRQIAYILDHGYKVISLGQLVEKIKSGQSARKNVVITFDDGYENNFQYAFPILKQNNLSATFFICPAWIDKEGYLNWQQVKTMQAAGMSFQSHTMNHAYLPDLPPDIRRTEMEESKRTLEKQLGVSVDFLAYPVGGFSEEIKEELKKAGYKAAVATNRGKNRLNKDLYELKRIRLSDNDTSAWNLWLKFSGYYNLFKKCKNPS